MLPVNKSLLVKEVLQGPIKEVLGFKATLFEDIYLMIFTQEPINFTLIYLLGHFLSSMPTNKVTLKPQNSLIPPCSNVENYTRKKIDILKNY